MPRRAGRNKPSIGNSSSGPPARNPVDAMSRSLTRGGSTAISASPQIIVPGYDGSVLTTWPTYEPIFTGRPHIVQFEPNKIDISFNIPVPWTQGNASTSDFSNIYQILVDNLATTYANAQNLQLAAGADWGTYINTWAYAFGIYYPLMGILNGDGFNDRMTQMSQAMTQYRSRIQTGYERLQTYPYIPGLFDLMTRVVGVFADIEGGDVIISILNQANANGIPTDLTIGANITTLLNQAELALATLQGAGEEGLVRIVLKEYYGMNPPLPWNGVKVGRSLYDAFHRKAVQVIGATNVFSWPYAFSGTAGTQPGLLPISIPKGAEKDPWHQTLFGYQPWAGFNNVAKANADLLGWISDFGSASSILRYYTQAGTTSVVSTLAALLNGYTDPWNDYLWAPPVAASDITGYGADLRVQRDFTIVMASFDYILQQTMELRRDVFVGKKRVSLPSDVSDWNAAKLQPRRTVVNL
jgi:hypothetical protein